MSDSYKPLPSQPDRPTSSAIPNARLARAQSFIEKNKKDPHVLQKIDFKKQLESYRERTEGSRPYTIMQIEDVMFIDKKCVVALEYIFYQKAVDEKSGKSNYQTAREHADHVDDCDHKLGAQEYQKNIDKVTKQANSFTDKPIIYDTNVDRQRCFLHEMADTHMVHSNEDGNESYQVEAMLSLWNISKAGTLMKHKEQTIDYPVAYQDCCMEHMRLTLSDDKKYISLSCTDGGDHSSGIHFQGWNTKNLKPLSFNSALLANVNKPVHGQIRSIRIVGNGFFILKEFVDNNIEQEDKKLRHRFTVWQLFDVRTGKKVFERNNKFVSSKAPNDPPALIDPDLRFIGLLPKPKVEQYDSEGNEDYDDFKERTQKYYHAIPTDAQEDQEEGDNEDIQPDDIAETLDFVFIFAKDAIKKVEKKKGKEKRKKGKENDKKGDDKWIWTFLELNVKELVAESQKEEVPHSKYVDDKVKDQFADKFGPNQNDFFNIPKNWFINKDGHERKWEDQITVTANKKFQQFALLNQSRKIYFAFDNTQQDDDQFQAYPIAENAIVKFARNQTLKEHLFIVYRIGNDTITTMFRNKMDKKAILFKDDHKFSWQDVQITQDKDDKVLLQSCTISQGDQEILLQTQVMKQNDEEGSKEDTVNRKSISQLHSGVFPVLCYNLGMSKIIAQNTLQDGKQYVIHLPKGHTFVNFIEFNKLEDIGFFPGNLRLEACSRFAFITLDQKDKWYPVFNINFLLIDPYYEDPQIVLFRSTKTFEADTVAEGGTPINLDTNVKMIAYCTKENEQDTQFDVKMIIQYPNHFVYKQLVTPDERDEEDEPGEEDDQEEYDSEYDDESDEQDEEEEEEEEYTKIASVPMLLDEQGHIYFVTIFDGQCIIKEINPTEDQTHTSIFELQSEACLGLSYSQGYFYLMDYTKKVNQLVRQQESISLIENDQFTIKDKDWNKFGNQTDTFSDVIMNSKYLIQGSKIFYLNNDIPFASGVLDMEDLKEEQWEYVQGPYLSKGCNEFSVVYKNTTQKQFKSIIYSLPDSLSTKLIGDYENKVDMSTFLEDGKILLKVGYRYMLFHNNGDFIDEIDFSDIVQEEKEQQRKTKISKGFFGLNPSLNAESNPIEDQDQQDKDEDDEDEDQKIEKQKVVIKSDKKDDKEVAIKRMDLIKISNNNKYFMFYDNKLKKMKVYEIRKEDENDPDNTEYQFKLDYDLDHEHEDAQELFKATKIENIGEDGNNVLDDNGVKELVSVQTIEEFRQELKEQTLNVIVEDDGGVRFTVNQHDKDDEKDVNINVYAGEFQKDGKYRDFNTKLLFDPYAKIHALQQLKQILKELQYQVEVENQQQSLLAPVLRNNKKLNKLNKMITLVEERMQNSVYSQIFDKDLLVVSCGRFIKYAPVDEDLWNEDKDLVFKNARIEFENDVIIEKIQTTCKKHHLQIVARDNKKQILIILTWDFDKDIEYSMLQFNIETDTRPENYVVRGLDTKINYFVNKHQIYDLEYNIPMQASGYNSMTGNGVGNRIPNQRKIFRDSSISLSVDHGSVLNNPVCRIDLIFWLNITDLGEKIEDISENTSLEQFNTIYGGISLIHHFADNIEVIEMLHDKFLMAKSDKTLTPEQEFMPLVSLYPAPTINSGNEGEEKKDGETALDVALAENRPHSFELIVDMLEDFDNFCLSKMMLTSFPNMIKMNTEVIKRFFASGVYKPPLMHFTHSVPWPEGQDSFVFPCYTSLMSKKLITQELANAGLLEEEPMFLKSKEEQEECKKKTDIEKRERKQKEIKEKMDLRFRKVAESKKQKKAENQAFDLDEENFEWLRSQLLPDHVQQENEELRVDVEAIDFDWIFVGDEEKNTSNAKNLLLLLDKQEDGELFVQKSIKIFIELVWEKYQYVIIKDVFIPYLLYLAFFVYLASSIAGSYLQKIEEGRKEDPNHGYYDLVPMIFCQVFTLICCACLYKFSFQMEIKQFLKEPMGYLGDAWNWVDLLSFIFNFFFLIFINLNVGSGRIIVPISFTRIVGATSCFLMWIKVFYWMRLFKSTAYFINLIIQTFVDSNSFALMLLIIVCAFANLFFIIQLNIEDKEDYHYVIDYTGEPVTSAWIAMFVLAQGDFHFGGYGSGPDVLIAWVFFILGSYLMLLVFMNVLIAIMGDTFGRVSQLQEQSALQEQVAMMNDFIDRVNIAKEFKDMRYIIRVSPIGGEQESSTDLQELFSEHGKVVSKKAEKQHQQLARRVEQFEKNTRAQMKSAQSKISNIKKEMSDQLKKMKTGEEGVGEKEEKDDDDHDVKSKKDSEDQY